MFKHEDSVDESVIEYDPVDQTEESTHDGTHDGIHGNGSAHSSMHSSAHDSTTDLATRRKTNRPKVALAATITCPECGSGNKPQWLNKSQRGDSYATTMFCEQCGCLMTVWAMSVDAQVVARKQ